MRQTWKWVCWLSEEPKRVDESHRAGTRIGSRARTLCMQVALDLLEEDAQCAIEGLPLMVKGVAQPLGKRYHPLAHRQWRQDMVDEMGRALGHAPGIAGGTDGAALTGEGEEEIMSALPTARPGETVGQNAALQIMAQLPLGVGRDALVLPVVLRAGKEGLQMVLHRAVERCFGGASPMAGCGDASLRLGGHVRIPGRAEGL